MTKDANPPFVIFPEGRFGTESSLRPYHRGSFEIAVQNSVPYLACALQYERPDIALWRGMEEERIISALWRMLTFRGKNGVSVIPMETVNPGPDDDAIARAADAQRATEDALGYEPSPTTFETA